MKTPRDVERTEQLHRALLRLADDARVVALALGEAVSVGRTQWVEWNDDDTLNAAIHVADLVKNAAASLHAAELNLRELLDEKKP